MKCDLDIYISIALILYINFATIDVFAMLFQLFRNMGFFFSLSGIFCCYILVEKLTHHHTYKDKLVVFYFWPATKHGLEQKNVSWCQNSKETVFFKVQQTTIMSILGEGQSSLISVFPQHSSYFRYNKISLSLNLFLVCTNINDFS